MKENCYSLRPGTILGFKGRSWKVITHETLDRRVTIRTMDEPTETKAFRYEPGQEIEIRWKPDTRL